MHLSVVYVRVFCACICVECIHECACTFVLSLISSTHMGLLCVCMCIYLCRVCIHECMYTFEHVFLPLTWVSLAESQRAMACPGK